MTAYVNQGVVQRAFKRTLDNVITDKTDGLEANRVYPKYLDVESMSDGWVEDAAWAGPGVIPEKPEGMEMQAGTVTPGFTKRYTPRTYAMRMLISEEAQEDCKYDQIINLAAMLKRAAYKTQEYDAANIPGRGWNASYTGWDGLPLFSTAHLLPNMDTYTNTFATPLAPSVAACTAARQIGRRMPGLDGFIEGFEMTKVCFPPEQEADWDVTLGSKMDPVTGNFSAINVAQQKMSLEAVCIPFWVSSTTNFFFKTNCPDGLKWKNRRKMRSRTWMTNEQEIESYGLSYRSDSGWTDPRGVVGSGA